MQTNSSVMSEIPEAKLPIVMDSSKKIDSKVSLARIHRK